MTGKPMMPKFTPASKFYADRECPCCHGQKYGPEANQFKVMRLSIGEFMTLPFCELLPIVEKLKKNIHEPRLNFALDSILRFLKKAIDLNLGYLFFHRAIPTLSGGELQRLRMVQVFNAQLTDMLIVLDEPLAGLDHAETDSVVKTLRTLVKEHGLTLVIIEHALNIPKILQIATTVWTLRDGRLKVGKLDTADEAVGSELRTWLQSQAKDGQLQEIDFPGGARLTVATRRKDTRVVLKVADLTISRGSRPVIAEPMSFAIKEGDFAILEAPNGWGKSTLLESIAGLVPSASGTIALFGSDATTLPVWKRAQMGLRLNRAAGTLFTRETVRENARLNHVTEPILQSLAGRKAGTLSGGESRRLSFEAFLNNPEAEILIFDEPFQALDITESARVRHSLTNCNKTILVTIPRGHKKGVL